jgi:NAD(P)H-dependent FMN reductase
MRKKKILAISGSTRSQSTNLHLLQLIANLAGDEWEVEIYRELNELPHFNPDLDQEGVPAVVERLRAKIREADGVIICTPEYVFSLPGALKNALEWTVSTMVFSEKPVALITASGLGEKAHEALLLIMKTIYAQVDEAATLLISGARSKMNEQGEVIHAPTMGRIRLLVQSFGETLKAGQRSESERGGHHP